MLQFVNSKQKPFEHYNNTPDCIVFIELIFTVHEIEVDSMWNWTKERIQNKNQ